MRAGCRPRTRASNRNRGSPCRCMPRHCAPRPARPLRARRRMPIVCDEFLTCLPPGSVRDLLRAQLEYRSRAEGTLFSVLIGDPEEIARRVEQQPAQRHRAVRAEGLTAELIDGFEAGCRIFVGCAITVLAAATGCSKKVAGRVHDHAIRPGSVRAIRNRAEDMQNLFAPFVAIGRELEQDAAALAFLVDRAVQVAAD